MYFMIDYIFYIVNFCVIYHFRCATKNVTVLPGCVDSGNATYITGAEYLDVLGFTTPLWLDGVILLTFWIGFHTLGYVSMRFMRKPKVLNL